VLAADIVTVDWHQRGDREELPPAAGGDAEEVGEQVGIRQVDGASRESEAL